MKATRIVGLVMVLAALCASSRGVADVVDESYEPPGHRTFLIERDTLAGQAFVALGRTNRYTHGFYEPDWVEAHYDLVDDHAIERADRICAVPAEWIVDSPVGPMGPRVVRGAPAGVLRDRARIDELWALFESDEVACSDVVPLPYAGELPRDVDAIEDTLRVVSASGRTLTLELVRVGYQRGQTTVTVDAVNGQRPPVPPRPSRCSCRAGSERAPGWALAALVSVALPAWARRLSRRRPDPAALRARTDRAPRRPSDPSPTLR